MELRWHRRHRSHENALHSIRQPLALPVEGPAFGKRSGTEPLQCRYCGRGGERDVWEEIEHGGSCCGGVEIGREGLGTNCSVLKNHSTDSLCQRKNCCHVLAMSQLLTFLLRIRNLNGQVHSHFVSNPTVYVLSFLKLL
ncbi:uncharacterized protein HKW66_Vig0119870 [Vigna angularis]|uniref:Uncharacterized protein n=1 Tax=Phaseolus angularis TaxID=3914 RepID=A0A8T0JWU0_PHAAN|nr:uncharacterized protein HKW66_Vig0119870 [Vigna angularis]